MIVSLCRKLCVLITDNVNVVCVNVMRAVLVHYVSDVEMR